MVTLNLCTGLRSMLMVSVLWIEIYKWREDEERWLGESWIR